LAKPLTGIVIAAVLAAVVAGLLVFGAVNSARKEVAGPAQVLVANQLIPKGSSGQAIATGRLYRVAKVSDGALVAGAVADVSALGGRVASRDIFPGQQITTADFDGAGGALTARLSSGDRAISISTDASHGLGGNLTAGDHVDVLSGFNLQNSRGVSSAVMRVLARDVVVLKAPNSSGSVGGGRSDTLTLRVSDKLAPQVAFAADNGKLWVVLRPAAGAVDESPSSVNLRNLLTGVKPLRGTP
jgi:Flp pilus assembly protein CpaB